MNKRINHLKVMQAIHLIENTELLHTTAQFHDESLEEIVSCYGIFDSWGRTEEKILMTHLYEIALRDEFREAALLVQSMEGEIMI